MTFSVYTVSYTHLKFLWRSFWNFLSENFLCETSFAFNGAFLLAILYVFMIQLNSLFLSFYYFSLIYGNYYVSVPAEVSCSLAPNIKKDHTWQCFVLGFLDLTFDIWDIWISLIWYMRSFRKGRQDRGHITKYMLQKTDIVCIKSMKFWFDKDLQHSVT